MHYTHSHFVTFDEYHFKPEPLRPKLNKVKIKVKMGKMWTDHNNIFKILSSRHLLRLIGAIDSSHPGGEACERTALAFRTGPGTNVPKM